MRCLALVLGVGVVVFAGCGGTPRGPLAPLCQGGPRGNGEDCLETSDGFLVPPWYYRQLQREERTAGVPHVRGERPTNPTDRQPATPAPLGFTPDNEGVPTEHATE